MKLMVKVRVRVRNEDEGERYSPTCSTAFCSGAEQTTPDRRTTASTVGFVVTALDVDLAPLPPVVVVTVVAGLRVVVVMVVVVLERA